MDETLSNQLSTILVKIENDVGSTDLVDIALKTLVDVVRTYDIHDAMEFMEDFKVFLIDIKSVKPKIGMLVYYFIEIYDFVAEKMSHHSNKEFIISLMIVKIEELRNEIVENAQKIVQNGIDCVEDSDNILVSSASGTLKNVLLWAKKAGKRFSVTLSEQSVEKTNNMIMFFQEHEIPFVVIPEFMCSHIEDSISKVFFGGITFNHNGQFVCSPWTNNIASEFHVSGKETYMFISTEKFSLWKTDPKKDDAVYKVKEVTSNNPKIKDYQKIKFSHDRIDWALFSHIVTEQGVFSFPETKKRYDENFKEKDNWRKKHSMNVME